MNKFLAKSDPMETIQEHTDNLISNYYKFKTIYPNLKIDWDILYLSCLYHDLGKMNKKFQDKIKRVKRHNNEIPHGILSLAFLNSKKLERLGYSKERIRLLAHSIAYHHDREFKFDRKELKWQIESMKAEADKFKYKRMPDIVVKKLSSKYFSMNRIYEEENNNSFFEYIKIKGLLNRLDYAASGYIDVENKNDFLLKDLEQNLLKSFKEKDPNASWNKLQRYMVENRDKNVMVIAQTGMGKTEAGLLWIGDNKGFFTLPLKTAINAMYERIIKKIVIERYEDKVGLLHSDIKREYINKEAEIDFDEYYNKTKQLSLPLTVCTMDQIFDFVYRYRGFESKLATLAYSKVVIDEVQMYSPDLLAYLIVGISYIDKIGGKFAVLTATLPQIFVELLKKEGVNFDDPEVFTTDRIRHSVKVISDKLNSDFIKEKYKDNKVLVICNTVKEAQRLYKELLQEDDIKYNVELFHSGFIKEDRKTKERNILNFGDKDNICKGIWITTQVVEASLDIDFDMLITELSDLNGLFQRMGRCYRNRDWKEDGYNCYVFNGGDKKTTGIGNVIDKDIFELSKKSLENLDGPITEDEKINLIDSIYTIEKLKDTDYYTELINTLEYVKLIESYEKSQVEIKKIFRNIETKQVIPREVYNKNVKSINNWIEIIQKTYEDTMDKENRKKLKMDKIKARIAIEDLALSVPLYRVKQSLLEPKEVNRYEIIEIFECHYNNDIGIQYIKKDEIEEEEKSIRDKFF